MEKKRKSGGIRKKLLCWILAVATVLTGAQIPAVSQAMGTTEMVEAAALKKGDPVKVRFTSSTGKVYSTLQIATKMGEKITLPLVPGYKTLKNAEWELDENFAFRAGESLTLAAGEDWDDYIVKGVLTFRAKKYYNVSFYNSSGSSNSAMRALEKTLEKGARFRLPYVPAVQGYAVLGWSTRKGASTPMYSERQAITVKKNMKFYAVRKKVATYTVTFSNNSGTSASSAYKSLNRKIPRNSTMTLPEVPKAKGYQNLGWTTARGKTKPLYKAGAKVKIAKHTKFYAVRRKSRYYTVNFYTKNGGMNSNYSGLQKKVEENSAITIPSVPARKGYVNLGWSAKRGSSSVAAKAGSSLKVTKNLKFYAAQEKAVSVVLHKNDGTVYKTITMGEGNYLSLPSVANAPGYTFMGWSKTMGQTADPQYEAGEKLRITEETHLYAVVFSRATETNIDEDNMAQPDLRKFKQIIFVGDSRTVRMKNVMEKEFDSYMTNGVRFIGGTGQGLEWLKTNGYGELMSIVGNDVSNVLAKPTAVIFNLGVNDLYNSAEYVAYMNEIAGTLKQKNCKLFYMSVNPVNSKMHAVTGHAVRKEEDVRLFNSRIRLGLSQNYIYIDTYAWLMKNGYSTDECKYGVDMDVDDGLHYGAKTYKRIYYYCLNFIM